MLQYNDAAYKYNNGNYDYWIQHAINNIYYDFGDRVSVVAKHKDLLKYGRTEQAGTGTATTIMTLPTGTLNETYVSSNLITTISSSSNSDTRDVVVEGHTISGGNLTFSVQTITLTGQTQATLTTPLARCTRIYTAAGDATDLVGNIYVYEDDTDTAGVPDTAAGVHCMIRAGFNQSEKASTSISSTNYWIITGAYGDVLQKTTATAEIAFEMRVVGSAFRKIFDYSASNSNGSFRTSQPYIVVPSNSDVRLRAIASGASTIVSGGMFGVLASVV